MSVRYDGFSKKKRNKQGKERKARRKEREGGGVRQKNERKERNSSVTLENNPPK